VLDSVLVSPDSRARTRLDEICKCRGDVNMGILMVR
jgi:hypothetical protein